MMGNSLAPSSSAHTGGNTPTRQVNSIEPTELGLPERAALLLSRKLALAIIPTVVILLLASIALGIVTNSLNLIPETKGMFSAIINSSEQASVNQKIVFAFFVISSACLLAMLTFVILGIVGKYKLNKLKKNSTTTREQQLEANSDARIAQAANHGVISFTTYLNMLHNELLDNQEKLQHANRKIEEGTFEIEDLNNLLSDIVENYEVISLDLRHHSISLPNEFTNEDYLTFDPIFNFLTKDVTNDIKNTITRLKGMDLTTRASSEETKLLFSDLFDKICRLSNFISEHNRLSFLSIESQDYDKTRYLSKEYNLDHLKEKMALVTQAIDAEELLLSDTLRNSYISLTGDYSPLQENPNEGEQNNIGSYEDSLNRIRDKLSSIKSLLTDNISEINQTDVDDIEGTLVTSEIAKNLFNALEQNPVRQEDGDDFSNLKAMYTEWSRNAITEIITQTEILSNRNHSRNVSIPQESVRSPLKIIKNVFSSGYSLYTTYLTLIEAETQNQENRQSIRELTAEIEEIGNLTSELFDDETKLIRSIINIIEEQQYTNTILVQSSNPAHASTGVATSQENNEQTADVTAQDGIDIFGQLRIEEQCNNNILIPSNSAHTSTGGATSQENNEPTVDVTAQCSLDVFDPLKEQYVNDILIPINHAHASTGVATSQENNVQAASIAMQGGIGTSDALKVEEQCNILIPSNSAHASTGVATLQENNEPTADVTAQGSLDVFDPLKEQYVNDILVPINHAHASTGVATSQENNEQSASTTAQGGTGTSEALETISAPSNTIEDANVTHAHSHTHEITKK